MEGLIYIGCYSSGQIPSGVVSTQFVRAERHKGKVVEYYDCWRAAEKVPGAYGKEQGDAAGPKNRERTKQLDKYVRDNFTDWSQEEKNIIDSII